MPQCPHCQQEHSATALFCPATGKAIPPPESPCVSCGREIRAGLLFCPYCGASQAPAPTLPSPPKPAADRRSLIGFGMLAVFMFGVVVAGAFWAWKGFPLPKKTAPATELSAAETPPPGETPAAEGAAPVWTASPTSTGAAANPPAQVALPASPPPSWAASPATDALVSNPQPLAGAGLVRLTNNTHSDYTPCLTPDQTALYYASQIGSRWQVLRADPDGKGEILQVTSGNADYYHPRISPDGSLLLVSASLGGSLDLYLIDPLTGEAQSRLTDDPADDYAPVWLPDQSGVLFTSDRDGNHEIFRYDLENDPQNLTNNPAFDGFPAVSLDGSQMVFYSNRDGNYDIYWMDLAAGKTRRLTQEPARDADPVFSPDGEWIVFDSQRSGNHELYAMRLDGSDLRNVSEHPANEYVPSFSPDGQWLLFQSDRDGNMELYRMPWEAASPASGAATDPSTTVINPLDSAELVFVPAGEFLMGSDRSTDPYFYGAEGPSHTVYLDEYWIYRTEVTNAMYQSCVEQSACPKPARPESNTRTEYYGNPRFDSYPVVYVSWKNAVAYCKWAGGRLPTEAEWEKAARGTDGRLFPWGSQPPQGNQANYGTNDTEPVGSYPAGASPYGALDMAGNVIEWVFDYFQSAYYSISPEQDPQGPASGSARVYRGGSYHNLAAALRVVTRGSRAESHANVDIGFRCVIEKP